MVLRLALLLLLAGCVPSQPAYTRLVRLTIASNVEAKCGTHTACVVISGNTCEIIAPKPRDYLDHFGMEVLGHELWHCFNGKNH